MRWPVKVALSSHQRGKIAEAVAKGWLRLKGYSILESRYRHGSYRGEIDCIAYKNHFLIAVEIKYRPSYSDAAFSLLPSQRRRIEQTFQRYLCSCPWKPKGCRFDVICVSFSWPPLRHLKNAWQRPSE